MRAVVRAFCLGLIVTVLIAPNRAVAQAPAAPPVTLWRFLGIPQAAAKVNAQIFNRRGNTPRLEKRPPLKPISDPANLAPDMPKPIQAAAKIKQAEDMAPQKKKAIKYLAEIGCGCYDKQGEVTDALVAAMDDCTESVRLDAVQAIETAAGGEPCCNCGSKCCCNEKILKKLAELAYERGDDGCYKEPSERVRQAAAKALTVCCTTQEPIEVLQEKPGEGGGGIERPADATPESGGEEQTQPTPAEPAGAVTIDAPNDFSLSAFIDAGTGARPQPRRQGTIAAQTVAATTVTPSSPQMQPAVVAEKIAEGVPRRGEVSYVNTAEGFARVKFAGDGVVPAQTMVRAFHKFLFNTSEIGEYMVIASNAGEVVIRKPDGMNIGKLSRGDLILVK